MATKPKELSCKDKKFEKYNDKYVLDSIKESDVVIIGWGSDSKKYVIRKREVERILAAYKYKIKCFKNDKGKKPRHPRDLTYKWTLDNYEFTFI